MTTYYVDGASGSDSNAGSSGSPWLTIAHGLATMVGGDILGVRNSVTYSVGTGLAATVGTYNQVTRMVGCTTTVGDGGVAIIQATAAITLLTISAAGEFVVEGITFDGNSGTGTQGVSLTGTFANGLVRCTVKGFSAEAISASSGGMDKILDCEITACGGTSAAITLNDGNAMIAGCAIHGNSSTGIWAQNYPAIINNRIYNNTGATSDGIFLNQYPARIVGNTIHGNGRHGLNLTYHIIGSIRDNIFTNNGGYGINDPGLGAPSVEAACDYNWFGTGSMANTSGARSANLLAGPHDLAGDPQYANAATGDFTPANSAVQAGSP